MMRESSSRRSGGTSSAIGRPIAAAGDRRNAKFVALLAALWLTDAVAWADAAGWLPGAAKGN